MTYCTAQLAVDVGAVLAARNMRVILTR